MTHMEKDKDGVIVRDNPARTLPTPQTRLKKPNMYHVVMYNDDFTPMDFVVDLLVKVFHHGTDAANAIMLEVHKRGKGIAGTYSWEVAETKANVCMETARMQQHPLQVLAERV